MIPLQATLNEIHEISLSVACNSINIKVNILEFFVKTLTLLHATLNDILVNLVECSVQWYHDFQIKYS